MTAPDPARSGPSLGVRVAVRALDFVLPGTGALLAGTVGAAVVVLALLALTLVLVAAAVCLGRVHPVNALLTYAVVHGSQGMLLALTALPPGPLRPRPGRAAAGLAGFLAVAGIGLAAGPASVCTVVRVDDLASFPGLVPGELLLVRLPEFPTEVPERGTLLAARTPDGVVVARVAGLPGERVDVAGLTASVDGRPFSSDELGEVEIAPDAGEGVAPEEARGLQLHVEQLGDRRHVVFSRRGVVQAPAGDLVPAGAVYLIGDNRSTGRGRDSRETGPTALSDVIGRPYCVLWSPRPGGGVRWDRIGAVWP
jgi:hypothetical protein